MRLTLLPALLLATSPLAAAPATDKPAAKPPAGQAPVVQPATEKPPAAVTPAPASPADDEKIIYAIGLSIWRSLGPLDLTPAEVGVVTRAIAEAAAGQASADVSLEAYGPKIQAFANARNQKRTEAEKVRSQTYLDKVAQEAGAVKIESGLIYFETQAGSGAAPAASDTVKVHYRGTLIDGTEFDSSIKRGQPAEFPLSGVIKCWTEGLQKMKVGGKARLVCPAAIAYGERGRPGIPGGAALTFEVELLDIVKKETPPAPAPPLAPSPAPAPAPSPSPKSN